MSSIFDPGAAGRGRSNRAARRGIIEGGGFSGPGGLGGGFGFRDNQASLDTSLGSFAPLLEQLQLLSSGLLAQGQGGLPSELQGLGEDTIGRLGNIDVNRLSNQEDFAGLGQILQSSLATASQDPFDIGSEISNRLRSLSQRRNQRLVNSAFDRLKASGKLGTTGGAGIAGELDRNLQDQDLQFDLAGLDFGQRSVQNAFARALGASGQREAIGARQFGEEFALENLGGQRALDQFGIGSSLFQQLLQSQSQGTQLGLGALQGAQGLSTLPLMFLAALHNSASLGSNSQFARAGIESQNAANAVSPFLEALETFGSFAGNVGLGFGGDA